MDIKMVLTVVLKDELWGFSSLLNGRPINEDTKEEILELLHEDWSEATEDGTIELSPTPSSTERLFSLEEALEIWKAGEDFRHYYDNKYDGVTWSPHQKNYFKARFGIELPQ